MPIAVHSPALGALALVSAGSKVHSPPEEQDHAGRATNRGRTAPALGVPCLARVWCTGWCAQLSGPQRGRVLAVAIPVRSVRHGWTARPGSHVWVCRCFVVAGERRSGAREPRISAGARCSSRALGQAAGDSVAHRGCSRRAVCFTGDHPFSKRECWHGTRCPRATDER